VRYLGEVTCNGSPKSGHFWRDALEWRLVWEEGDQRSIQSPLGGTKISWDVWHGTVYEPGQQRFDLVATDYPHESERLMALGAMLLKELRDGVAMTDPDGNAFTIRGG
jgi:hypothetical protein